MVVYESSTPIRELWTKNLQTGRIMERHLWTKNPQKNLKNQFLGKSWSVICGQKSKFNFFQYYLKTVGYV